VWQIAIDLIIQPASCVLIFKSEKLGNLCCCLVFHIYYFAPATFLHPLCPKRDVRFKHTLPLHFKFLLFYGNSFSF